MLQKFIASAGIIFAIASANLVLQESAIGLAIAQRTNTTVPTRDILAKLKPSTRVPIFLPSRLPFSDRVYYNSQTTENGYSVEFNLTPNCQGTPCYIGSIEAEKGGQFITREPGLTRTLKNIRLARGTRGVFHNGCGAYCTASVEWQSQGVLYRVSLKNGLEADAIQIANSAIEAGRR
jgi:hypothetical protein